METPLHYLVGCSWAECIRRNGSKADWGKARWITSMSFSLKICLFSQDPVASTCGTASNLSPDSSLKRCSTSQDLLLDLINRTHCCGSQEISTAICLPAYAGRRCPIFRFLSLASAPYLDLAPKVRYLSTYYGTLQYYPWPSASTLCIRTISHSLFTLRLPQNHDSCSHSLCLERRGVPWGMTQNGCKAAQSSTWKG